MQGNTYIVLACVVAARSCLQLVHGIHFDYCVFDQSVVCYSKTLGTLTYVVPHLGVKLSVQASLFFWEQYAASS
jgi:hypothetical protein